jgi:hypothetical protein
VWVGSDAMRIGCVTSDARGGEEVDLSRAQWMRGGDSEVRSDDTTHHCAHAHRHLFHPHAHICRPHLVCRVRRNGSAAQEIASCTCAIENRKLGSNSPR